MFIFILKISLLIKLIVMFVFLVKIVYLMQKEIKGKEYLINDTYEKVDKLGCVTSVNGKQRSGKTLTVVLLVHTKIILLQEKLQQRLDKIISCYVEFDFNVINETLDKYFESGINYSTEYIYLEMFKGLKGVSFDFLNMRSVEKDLKDYIDFYYILNYRNNYILSNFHIFCRITLTNSKFLDNDTLELKNLYKTMNYRLDRALIIVRGEMNVENGNVNSNNKEMKTSGIKELYSLIGNMYEELTSIITDKQINEDEFIGTRRLEVTRLDMNSCNEIIYNFDFLQKCIDKWLKFQYWLFTFKYKFIFSKRRRNEKIERSYLKANNRYRKKEFFWNGIKSFFNAQGLIVINVDITENKKTTENVELVFPVKYGYGTYQTHDYTCVHQELSRISKTSFIESEDNIRFDSPQKIKQKCKFLYENREKEEKKENDKEVIDIW